LNPISPDNIHQHELIGLSVEIINSTNKKMIGKSGVIIDETKNLFVIESSLPETNQSQRMKVEKKVNTFRFSLPSGEMVDVDGQLLKNKPENRLKNIIRKRW